MLQQIVASGDSTLSRLLLAFALLLAPPAFAVPSPDGLTGVIRLPSAHVEMGSTTFKRETGWGASFTYPVVSAVEAGVTREEGGFALHGKVQFVPETLATPALAVAVQDWTRQFGSRKYFWAASKRFESLGAALHGGVKRSGGLFEGAKDYYAGAEYDLLPMVRLKGEYDWGRRAGSTGLELHFGSSLVVYDYVLDAFGSGRDTSNLIGVSFQRQF